MAASFRARAESRLTSCHGQDGSKVQAKFMITEEIRLPRGPPAQQAAPPADGDAGRVAGPAHLKPQARMKRPAPGGSRRKG